MNITVDPSPTNLIEITAAPSGLILTNRDPNRTVVGLSVIWTPTIGKPKVQLTDSFMLPKYLPVIAPGASIAVGPAGIVPPTGAIGRQSEVAGGHFTLDAVLFEDGQIVGPNTELLDYEITASKAPS